MKRLLLSLVALAFLAFVPNAANAACTGTAIHGGAGHACFAIATGTWSSNIWSATSGGGTCACAPTTGDDLVFDASSPTGTYTATAISLNSLDASAAPASLVISHPSGTTVTITGTFFALSTAMTYTPASGLTSLFTFTSTSGTTAITTGGKTLGSVTFNGIGGTFQIQDSFNGTFTNSSVLTLTNGTFDPNGKTIAAAAFTWTGGSSSFGTATFNAGVSGTAAPWTATGTTITPGTATINVALGAANTTFAGGGKSYPTVNFASSGATSFTITGANTFATLGITAPSNVRFPNATITTITNAITWAGSSSNQIEITSSGVGTQATISTAANCTPSWIGIKDMAFVGGGNFTATNSFSFGDNSISGGGALSITAPSGGSGRIIGG